MRMSPLEPLTKRILRVLPGRSFGLRQKFLLAFTGLVLGLTIGLLLIVEHRQRLSIINEMQKRGVTIASHLAAVSTKSMLTYNFVALEQDVEKISQDRDVLYAIILDREGRVAAYSGHDEQHGMILQDQVSQQAAGASAVLIQRVSRGSGRAGHYDIAVPVFVQGSPEKWGTVRVGLSLRSMQMAIRETRLRVMLLGILGVGLGTVVAVFLTQRMLAPIRVLARGTVAVARGDLQHTIPVQTRDELGILASNFNHMTHELQKHHMALAQTNYELDQKVRELSLLANYNASILSSMTSGLFTLALDGRFETFNATAETLTGLQLSEVHGRVYQQVFTDNVQLVQVIEASRHHRTPLTVPRLEFRRADGHRVPYALRTAMLQDGAGNTSGLLVIFEDLSPIQTLEGQLHQADRLAALGKMAAGIAHEIKNPLASIKTFAQLVSRKHQDPAFLEKFDRVTLYELDRINRIVEELLELARPTRMHYTQVDVPALLQRVVDTHSERMLQQHIVAKVDFATALPTLEADAEQLYRAFANLSLNAIEAMPEGGELRLSCRPVPRSLFAFAVSSPRQTLSEPQHDGSATLDQYTTNLEIAISDTGVGIPSDQIEMLYTPFYTTKPKGTGLGLALTHKIVEAHRGRIHIDSQVDQGTVATVILPYTI